jgi:hypothetical protein
MIKPPAANIGHRSLLWFEAADGELDYLTLRTGAGAEINQSSTMRSQNGAEPAWLRGWVHGRYKSFLT